MGCLMKMLPAALAVDIRLYQTPGGRWSMDNDVLVEIEIFNDV